jgi:hypothetical protein
MYGNGKKSLNNIKQYEIEIKVDKSHFEKENISDKNINLSIKNIDTIQRMLERFKNNQIDVSIKKNKLKKEIFENEMAKIKPFPEINKTKFTLENESFYKRMEIKKKEVLIKNQKIKDEVEKAKIERNKLNPRLNQKLEETKVQATINSMLKWETERRDKIKYRKYLEEKKESMECTFKPKLIKRTKLNYSLIDLNKSRSLSKTNTERRSSTPNYKDLKDLKRNLMKNEFIDADKEKEISNREDNHDIPILRIHENNNLNKINNSLNLNTKLIEKVTFKESKIIEELLRKKSNFHK